MAKNMTATFLSVLKFLFALTLLFLPSSGEPLWEDVCTQDDVRSLPFCDSKLGIEDRVADYTQRIPIEKQIPMLVNNAAGFDDLHIPKYQWWSEGLHGPLESCIHYSNQCFCPTSFPCPSALGNTFNATLYHLIGSAIGIEGRAISNLKAHLGKNGDGITYWSPVINMQRDPRWGRNQEAPGEDPHLTSIYATNFVRGLHGDGDIPNVASCCKHFVANSLEQWYNYSRHNFNAQVSFDDLYNYYFPPFQECVKHAMGVMCSYNSLNGVPACANEWLLKKVLRNDWNFTGYITTDCGAILDIYGDQPKFHHYANNSQEASAKAINATVDSNCGSNFHESLLPAMRKGLVEGSKIRESFSRLATVQFQLGLFDPKSLHPSNDAQHIDTAQHRSLALEAALQSIVLLQNKGRRLPLDPDMKLALIGPHLNASEVLLSNYHGDKCSCGQSANCIETPFHAIQKRLNNHIYSVLGCEIDGSKVDEIYQAVEAAKEADATIVFLGLNQRQEEEGRDRTITHLPGLQPQLLNAILEVASNRTILVLLHGGSLSLGKAVLDQTPAIISASYGGQSGSRALAGVLFGDYNPTGKLSATWYPPTYIDDLPLTEMGLNVGVGRTHLYYKGTPEFAFGHGLSYSKWDLEWAKSSNIKHLTLDNGRGSLGRTTRIRVLVKNIGPLPGRQTILLFWRPKMASLDIQEKLIGFEGTDFIGDGDEAEIKFEIKWSDFALWSNRKSSLVASLGDYELEVRASEVHIRKSIHLVDTKDRGDEAYEY